VECPEHNGLHIYVDHFLPEIINPVTGQKLEEGKTGELVLTTLTREATPVLRFRTGDITSLTTEECSCQRTLTRMSRILGRADDMFKVRGVKMWPTTLEHALLLVAGASQNYQIMLERPELLDIMTVKVEPQKEVFERVGGDLSQLQGLNLEIAESIRSVTGIKANVVLVPCNSLPRFEGKARRIKDLRKDVAF